MVVEGLRGPHRVLQSVPQVWRRVGVDLGQVGQAVVVAICGICGFRLSRIRFRSPATADRSPAGERLAVAVSVWFILMGSTCSAIEVTVSNRVSNSVVTADASITSWAEMRCRDGFSVS